MKIDNIQRYVYDQLNKGEGPNWYKKYAKVKAEQGVAGQKNRDYYEKWP